ncbi:hypothetical protein C8R45DRAFT_1104734 [Mycena sanguinolenta]|nr:hypothetical protein C8R45DRAFT_1104734 [Mycena sanguinolenta]
MSTNHKCKVPKRQLVVASTVASVSHMTHDQQRVRIRTTVVDNAGPSVGAQTEFWADDLTTNLAQELDAFLYQLGDSSLEAQPDYAGDDGITVVVKAGRNTDSDRPLQNWYAKNDEYVEESLRRKGRGLLKTHARCASSRVVDPTHPHANHECHGVAEWRCVDQVCLGELMFCSACIVATHMHHPTHFVEKWVSDHFVRKRNWLQLLGLRVQLGLPPGIICPYCQAAAHDFVLFDVTGVHELNVDFCDCQTGADNESPRLERQIQLLRACWWPATITAPNTCATFTILRLFQKLNCLGKLSA